MPPFDRSSLLGAGRPAALLPWPLVGAMFVAAFSCDRLASCSTLLEAPETQIRRALSHQDPLTLSAIRGPEGKESVELHSVRFEDVVSTVEGDRALVVAMVTAKGSAAWDGQKTTVLYIGREKFHMRRCASSIWCREGDETNRLRAVLSVLMRRWDSAQRGDGEGLVQLLSPRYDDRGEGREAIERRLLTSGETGPNSSSRVVAWQIRVDRDIAEVGEDLQRETRRERHVYRFDREGDRWGFVAGL